MKLAHFKQLNARSQADALVLPFWKDKQKVEPAADLSSDILTLLEPILKTGDFKAKEGEVLYLYVKNQPEERFILLGLGAQEKLSVENLRRSYGSVTKSCLVKRIQHLNIVVPYQEQLSNEDMIKGISEGLFLPNYTFNRHKQKDPDEPEESLLNAIHWIGPQSQSVEISQKIHLICEAIYYTRHLVNGNADDVTPQYLSDCAQNLAKEHASIKTTVFDKKRIEEEKMGLLLAVNRGSALDPVFIIMEYKGNPQSKDHTVFVGKGITYDTGGLNLKPTGSMETMKCDMAGGAACFGIILAVASLKLKVNVTVVIPSTENGIDAKSFKPGDVYQSYLGKTVEMTNSDAEGRLILADALAYAAKNLNPSRLIDLATLTGAIEIALGSEASGLMCTSDVLAQQLQTSGQETFERVWRMPLFDEYKERLKSDIADLKSWNGRSAGANVAATFLSQFVMDYPWAHLDIAGTAYVSEAKKYLPKYATGTGVRLMVDFLEKISSSN